MPVYPDGSYKCAKSDALIAKVMAGQCLMTYTKAAVGQGYLLESTPPKDMTAPAGYVMDAPISSASNPSDGECQVSIQIDSADVTTGFDCTGIVLYASDPDEGEIPFTYLVMEEFPEQIRASTSAVGKLTVIDVISAVGNISSVSASIDTDIVVTQQALTQKLAEVNSDIASINLKATQAQQDIEKCVKHNTYGNIIGGREASSDDNTNRCIAIGESAKTKKSSFETAEGRGGIAIGDHAEATGKSISVGQYATSGLGRSSQTPDEEYKAISIGVSATTVESGIAIGEEANAYKGIAIGKSASTGDDIAIGNNAICNGNGSAQIGAGQNDEANTLQFKDTIVIKDGVLANECIADWEEISLANFADMVVLSSSGDQWTASILYNATLKVIKAHFHFVQIAVDYNTGDVIGTIKTAYRPKFMQYGQALIGYSNTESYRPVIVATDGSLSIGKAYDGSMPEVIDNLYFLDITYITA